MLSRLSYIFCTLVLLYTSFIFYPKRHPFRGESVLGWDVTGYYWYLPSIFIYKDLKQQKFGDSLVAQYQFTPSFEQSYVHESGNRVMNYSAGMAVMYLPFFTVAHLAAEPLGYRADGFTEPYQLAILIGSILAALVGLWYMRKLFLYYYSDKMVAVLLLLLVIGTNYLNYSTIDGALTHNWLFTIYVFLLLNTRDFYLTPSYKYAIRIGLLCGIAILIRPSEMIAALIPLLWGMETISVQSIKNKFSFLRQHFRMLLAAAFCTIAIGSIQVVYWLYVTGKPLVYSYGDKGFSWLHPHWGDFMLSYKSGWITYTPLAILFFIGIIPFFYCGKNKVAIVIFSAINLYIVCAWDVWWYGGTGGRAMIQSYPVMLFFIASLLQFLFSRKWRVIVAAPVILLLAYFNIWFTYNAHAGQGLYDPNGMTKAYYWRVIYRYKIPPYYDKLKDTDEYFEGEPKNMQLVYQNDFEQDTLAVKNPFAPINGKRSVFVEAHTNSPHYTFPYKTGKAKWLRAHATFYSPALEWEVWRMPQLVVAFEEDKTVKINVIRLHRFMWNGATKDLYIDVKIPGQHFDSVAVYVFNWESRQGIGIDNLKVWSFDE
jgi:hypothetical protein